MVKNIQFFRHNKLDTRVRSLNLSVENKQRRTANFTCQDFFLFSEDEKDSQLILAEGCDD